MGGSAKSIGGESALSFAPRHVLEACVCKRSAEGRDHTEGFVQEQLEDMSGHASLRPPEVLSEGCATFSPR